MELDWGNALAVDHDGNSYIAGVMGSTNSAFGGITLTNHGLDDMFVAKYDSAGNALWAANPGSAGYEGAFGIAVDQYRETYVLGNFSGAACVFGNTTLTNFTSHEQLFVAKFDANGSPLWAQQAGGNDDTTAMGIALDPAGNSYVTGSFLTNDFFGNTLLTNSSGGSRIFVARIDGPPVLKMSVTEGQLSFSWPTNQTGYTLESSAMSSGTTIWQSVANTAQVIGTDNIVIENYFGIGKLYRLRKP